MLRRVALVRTDVSEEISASTIRMTRIGELGTLAVTNNRRALWRNTCTKYKMRRTSFSYSCHPDNGGAKFLRNVGSYKNHKA
jgi:hypothetical protein